MDNRDNLSGKKSEGLLKIIEIPGKVVLWLFYMFPIGGYEGTRMSSRWARSPIMTVVVGAIFWVLVLSGLVFLIVKK